MKNLPSYIYLCVIIVVFTACQKELNFDTIPGSNGLAVGTLQSASGVCSPTVINGNFFKDSVLKPSNFMQVNANITATGSYTIKSDTIAGFYFIGTGTASNIGNNVINLAGIGTPTSTGIKTFTVSFGTSICKINVNINAGVAANAVYTFTCAGTTFGSGIYMAGVAVGAQHTVSLLVNVTTPGPWAINVAAINMVSFAGSGTFATTGAAQVTLTAVGTPTVASPPAFNYTVTSGTSSCIFAITVAAPSTPANLDYVPQTSFSNWSAKLVGGTPADTTYVQVSANSKTFGANSYKIFEVKNMGVPTDSIYNRKNGGLYYQYIDGNLGVLDNPINKEYLVLDSNLAVNASWTANFGPNIAMGFPLSNIRVDAQILGKGETQTVALIVYNNVIRMKYSYTATVIGLGDIPVAEEERWFAKGIGVIRSSIVNLINPATTVNETTRSQIF
jgi:hypothetical protein